MANMTDSGVQNETVSPAIDVVPFDEDTDENSDQLLDRILSRIGGFTRFQILNYVVFGTAIIFNAMQTLSLTFYASPITYRCNISQCDSVTSGYWEPWLNFTIPLANASYNRCGHYEFHLPAESSSEVTDICNEKYFKNNTIKKCANGYKFLDEDYALVKKFELFCSDDWKLAMMRKTNDIGRAIGMFLGGVLCDKLGRRKMLLAAGILSASAGIINEFSKSYLAFVISGLFVVIFGSMFYPAAFLLAIESVGSEQRAIAATMVAIYYCLGEILVGAFVKITQHWAFFVQITCITIAAILCKLKPLPESVQWLLSNSKEKRCIDLLKKTAHSNHACLRESQLEELIASNRNKLRRANQGSYPLWPIMKTIPKPIMNILFSWIINIAARTIIEKLRIDDSNTNNFIYSGLIQIPALLLTVYTLSQSGRSFSLLLFMAATCLGLFCIAMIDKNTQTVGLMISVILTKMATTASLHILYISTFELFPTNLRNSILSIFSVIASIVVIMLVRYVPVVIIAIFVLVSGCVYQLIPDTSLNSLPITVGDLLAFNFSELNFNRFSCCKSDSLR